MKATDKSTALVIYRKRAIKPNKKKSNRTICEVLRELYREADERGDIAGMAKIDQCHDMAKRMQYKLYEYYAAKNRTKTFLISIQNADGTYTIEERG